jgi:hypothetical protein
MSLLCSCDWLSQIRVLNQVVCSTEGERCRETKKDRTGYDKAEQKAKRSLKHMIRIINRGIVAQCICMHPQHYILFLTFFMTASTYTSMPFSQRLTAPPLTT